MSLDLRSGFPHITHMLIFKILRPSEWDALCAQKETLGAPIDQADGYIHFSTAAQVAETLAKHFSAAEGLILAAYEADAFGDALRWEVSRGGDLFPHLYGKLPFDGVLWHHELTLEHGLHILPYLNG